MSANSFKFQAGFQLYDAAGIRYHFGVADDDGGVFLNSLAAMREELLGCGYSATLPGLEDGEQTETVEAWVLGENKKQEPVVHLYGLSHLKYRVATVFVEDFGKLPFEVDANGQRWLGSAPERDDAEQRELLHAVTPFEVVMEPHEGKGGKTHYRFARVHGAAQLAKDLRFTMNDVEARDMDAPQWPSAERAEGPNLVAKLDKLGADTYGDEWGEKSQQLAEHVTNGGASRIYDLSDAELTKLINGITQKRRKAKQPPADDFDAIPGASEQRHGQAVTA